jgi:hypothetical protein
MPALETLRPKVKNLGQFRLHNKALYKTNKQTNNLLYTVKMFLRIAGVCFSIFLVLKLPSLVPDGAFPANVVL